MTIISNLSISMHKKNSKFPMRSTTGSAGYDVFSDRTLILPKNKIVNIRLPFVFAGDLTQNVMARLFVRSSFGIKKKLRLVENGNKNIDGITLNLNDDNYIISVLNEGEKDLIIKEGEHFAQFILSTKFPKEEKAIIEKVFQNELDKHRILKSSMDVVRPDVYDYIVEEDIYLNANEQLTFPTGLKALINDGTWLAISTHEDVKDKIMLANQIVVGDKDYYNNSENDGNYFLGLVNLKNEPVILTKGTRLTRWWSEKFLILDNEKKTNKIRTGGIGSTTDDKK